MKKVGLILAGILVLIILGVLFLLSYYKYQIGPVSDSNDKIAFEINEGDNYYTIASRLEESGLIKNKDIYMVYLKLNPQNSSLNVGIYYLKPNMGVKGIINELNGNSVSTDIIITFKEGRHMRYIAKNIANNTNNTEADVYALLKDKTYLNELIKEYWFIDSSILNKDIYYSLEGYLYPNTYNFKDKDVTVKEIFKVMLDETEKQIEPYKNSIIASKYNFHQLVTLGSVIELEAKNEEDRKLVSSVFYNRLRANMPLGSDVTTYYAAKVEMSERDLYKKEINDVNAYNTRPLQMSGKLPVGPICNPSISSIVAAINPAKSNYYFFVADKNGKVYYTKSNKEHEQLIIKLKSDGLWYTY